MTGRSVWFLAVTWLIQHFHQHVPGLMPADADAAGAEVKDHGTLGIAYHLKASARSKPKGQEAAPFRTTRGVQAPDHRMFSFAQVMESPEGALGLLAMGAGVGLEKKH